MKLMLVILAAVSASATAGLTCTAGKSTCYKDFNSRILLRQYQPTAPLTHEACAAECYACNFTLAGVEDGNQCFCGHKLAQNVPATNCNMACPGDSTQMCGGNWAINVFDYTCTGGSPPDPNDPVCSDKELVNPCLDTKGKFASMPFCDATLDIDARVADAVSRLTIAEKISALGTGTGALPSLGLPPYNWWSEATHGISHVRNDATTPYARRDSAEDFSRLGALLFTAMAWIFIPTHCFAIP